MHWTVIWSSHFSCSFIRVAFASSSARTQRSSNVSAVPSWRVSSLWQGVSGFRWSWFLCETLGYFHGWPVVYVFNTRRRSSSTKLHTTWLQCKCTSKIMWIQIMLINLCGVVITFPLNQSCMSLSRVLARKRLSSLQSSSVWPIAASSFAIGIWNDQRLKIQNIHWSK